METTFAPAPATPRLATLPVTPVNPVRGWQSSSRSQRILAAASLVTFTAPLTLGWLAGGVPAAVISGLGMLVGPVGFYLIARMLRPHEAMDGERIARHALSAASTYWGFLIITGITLSGTGEIGTLGGGLTGYAFLAAITGPITVVWGLGAMIVRMITYVRTPVRSDV